MQAFFQKLLKSTSDDLSQAQGEGNQTQKEAIVDLCLLGMYSDDLISITEQDFIEEESTHLDWQSEISFSRYLQTTIPKIRSAKSDSQKVKDLLQNIAERLGSDDSKRRAVDELRQLLAIDGVVKLEEEFLFEAKRVMGI
jgi:hypothetical protein